MIPTCFLDPFAAAIFSISFLFVNSYTWRSYELLVDNKMMSFVSQRKGRLRWEKEITKKFRLKNWGSSRWNRTRQTHGSKVPKRRYKNQKNQRLTHSHTQETLKNNKLKAIGDMWKTSSRLVKAMCLLLQSQLILLHF